MPTVSIGLPVYNGESYLAEAIDSILNQDFADFELVISDNASTDSTQQICEAYAASDPRVRYSREAENLGAAFNYNRVFELSTGTYFKWAAHDDLIAPRFLSTCVRTFESFATPPALVHPSGEFIDASGATTGPHEDTMDLRQELPAMRSFHVLQGLSMIASVFGLFHRETLAQTRLIGSFIASDYALLLETALLGKIVFVDGEPLFQRRVHLGMSRQANTSKEDVLRWFDPKASTRLTTKQRLYIEYLRSVRHVGELSVFERSASAVAVVSGVMFKQSRVHLGRWRREIKKKVSG